MPKRLGLNLSDDTHAQIKQRADAAGISVNAWILAAIERETFRQLCQETNTWWAERPELAERETEDYFKRANGARDSSAA
ncbi:hypothetical protein SAMN05421504_102516 [Amycolatopsis xylanica]|uniref:HicB family protein n=1 Tax=Amycolatopsis xylanica TaxID=589385 RepID=A0A1H2ZIL1_9PSEU|nr:hypothetical protein [Amycolatopsis xylanica]SDX16559.1 hypothetical protein SAMN05421504_102516 [Amycolatopsis xylanica]